MVRPVPDLLSQPETVQNLYRPTFESIRMSGFGWMRFPLDHQSPNAGPRHPRGCHQPVYTS